MSEIFHHRNFKENVAYNWPKAVGFILGVYLIWTLIRYFFPMAHMMCNFLVIPLLLFVFPEVIQGRRYYFLYIVSGFAFVLLDDYFFSNYEGGNMLKDNTGNNISTYVFYATLLFTSGAYIFSVFSYFEEGKRLSLRRKVGYIALIVACALLALLIYHRADIF
ncbi:hypothetical protein [Prevotella sp. 10(H)]|uniref:hypothetical protein n=1 Tax=Prevotella sp. 10(H) TaxID=1158294 RepID=UPI0012DF3677|nr:hypothetical protein [Prevotella sp. 10(H)]